MSDQAAPTVPQLFDLTGRTALITGASGHLGKAFTDALAEAGCRVVVSSRQIATAQAIAGALGGAQHGRHLAVALDMMDEKSLESGFSRAVELAGQVDVLVNNGFEVLGADWRTVTGEQFTRQLANTTGYFLLARRVRDEAVKRAAPASIIMLGSMYGQVASYPDVYEGVSAASPAAYQAFKGGVIQLTRHLAVYWAKDRVRVNCLSPGPFPLPGIKPEVFERLRAKCPMGRTGETHEVKGAVVFLASDASSYVTGHNLNVDGGWTAW